jgi:hypothetical protein
VGGAVTDAAAIGSRQLTEFYFSTSGTPERWRTEALRELLVRQMLRIR